MDIRNRQRFLLEQRTRLKHYLHIVTGGLWIAILPSGNQRLEKLTTPRTDRDTPREFRL
ncbi:hypothetical protein K9N68_10530 [Kovacikia minuta CCNUW1]|uniref:hypothetical protein n=1 Tax=Kovacikia minuta TaxID=2931930 RepID=UPI001CC915D3|nr:hypothetical protein [Kovacikia minuta]UBF28269.1 hypothetical protein K9N68_10530 [Kovacikia minuta CCNUW1]